MVKSTKTTISPLSFLFLLGLSLGYSIPLYAAHYRWVPRNKVYVRKDRQGRQPKHTDRKGNGPQDMIPNEEVNDKADIDWACTSIQDCEALCTIIGCLHYWAKLSDTNHPKHICNYLSSANNYKDVVSAYHHLLDRHLDHQKDQATYAYIHQKLKKTIVCDFATCKAYTRNQRERGRDRYKAAEDDDKEYLFLQDFLDSIHAYLVHGSDSGHRYVKGNKPLKAHQPPQHSGNDHKEDDEVDIYTLIDKEMTALAAWQYRIKKQSRTQIKTKFSTTVVAEKQKPRNHISLDVLAAYFKHNPTIAQWLQYIRTQECDTDVLLHNIYDDAEDNILYNSCKSDKSIAAAIANHILQEAQANQQQARPKKTASYCFGVRLYYWPLFKKKSGKDQLQPPYRYQDLYVAPTYLSLKNEILAKHIALTTWNQKMYEGQLMLAQSPTLKKTKANKHWQKEYGIKQGAGLSTWHILSIVFYTDFTALSAEFSASLRYLSASESLKGLIKRNSKWHYLSKYLREVVECFGTQVDGWSANQLKDIRGDIYYHGVSYLLFTAFSVHWFGPLSTSKQLEVAILFTPNSQSGLLLELKEDHHWLHFFNVALLSSFGAENERLFIGGYRSIQIASIRLLKHNRKLAPIIHTLFIVNSIIRGKRPGKIKKALPIDGSIFKDLCTRPTKFPSYVQNIWRAFRHQQESIKIDIRHMYQYYKIFIPLLFAPQKKDKNVLLLDKIAKIFPNVSEIISIETDNCGGWNKSTNSYHAAYIVDSNFMSCVQASLRKMSKRTKLKKISIKTAKHQVHCKLYASQFEGLGWQVGKGAKTIVITKDPYDVLPKVSAVIRGEPIPEATSLDAAIFKKLIAGAKDVPPKVRLLWNNFSTKPAKITINLMYIYQYHKAFFPLLVNSRCKNLLLFDTIAKIFPNVTEIRCKKTDYVGNAAAYHPDEHGCSSAVVSSAFVLALQKRLHMLHKQAKLTKILISTSEGAITDSCNLYATQFRAFGWTIERSLWKDIIILTKTSAASMSISLKNQL